MNKSDRASKAVNSLTPDQSLLVEMAYRRGLSQGAWFAIDSIANYGSDPGAVKEWQERVEKWRRKLPGEFECIPECMVLPPMPPRVKRP